MTDTETLLDRARRVLAYGGHHRVLLRALYEGEESVFPHFAAQARGYELIDSDGKRYVDWVSAWGPALLGYRHPDVEAAVQNQLEAGPLLSLTHPVEIDVAELLTETVPCAEMVAFGKNGSDVLTAAVRIARAATGRDVILHHGFHGFHDWYVSQHPEVLGVPSELRSLIHSFPYDDLPALAELFERLPARVAGVVMEPFIHDPPSPGYLEGVRALANENGALLIFDEMFTGLRLAPGGAQEVFGVQPDLTCFGKSLANGMPLAAVMGAARYMRYLPHVAYGMTFRGETLSLAAARAVLRIVRDEPVAHHLADIGNQLREGLSRVSADEGVPCSLVGAPSRMLFVFDDFEGLEGERLKAIFLQGCAANGVLTHGGVLPSYSHDEEAVARTLDGFRSALSAVKDVAQSKGASDGALGSFHFSGSRGFIETMEERDDRLHVYGWVLLNDGASDEVELVATSDESWPADRVKRPDVAGAYPRPNADGSGYRAILPAALFAQNGRWQFEIRAKRGSETILRCAVSRRRRAEPLPCPYAITNGPLYL